MNDNNECKIVEDLLYGYNESLLNQESSEFVNCHLKSCINCTKKLEQIKDKILNENNLEKQEDEIELLHLLKVNRTLRILKISLTVLILFIILILSYTFIKGNQADYIIENAQNKLIELQKLDNYKLTKNEIYISHEDAFADNILSEIYYKDGKYKESLPGSTFFYSDESNERIYVYEELNGIEKSYGKFITKGEPLKEDFSIKSIYSNEKNIFQKATYEIASDTFRGIDCYIIRVERENNQYREIWINKENFITVRSIENFSAYYREIIYDININNILDSDVTFNKDNYINYTLKDFTENIKNSDVMIYND